MAIDEDDRRRQPCGAITTANNTHHNCIINTNSSNNIDAMSSLLKTGTLVPPDDCHSSFYTICSSCNEEKTSSVSPKSCDVLSENNWTSSTIADKSKHLHEGYGGGDRPIENSYIKSSKNDTNYSNSKDSQLRNIRTNSIRERKISLNHCDDIFGKKWCQTEMNDHCSWRTAGDQCALRTTGCQCASRTAGDQCDWRTAGDQCASMTALGRMALRGGSDFFSARFFTLLLLAVLLVFPTGTLSIVTIPPSLLAGPPSGELLFTVTYDRFKEPDAVTLPCRADAMPPPTYSWLKNGEEWDPTEGENVVQTEGEGTITFEDPQPEDEGVYQCVASNSAGKLYTDKTWMHWSTLGYFPTKDPKVVTTNLGDPLTLECDAPKGYPDPSTTWLLQSSDGGLRNLENSRITIDDHGTLRFAYVIRDDTSVDALYACAASSATSSRDLYVVEDESGTLILTDVDPDADDDPDDDDDDEAVTSITIPTEYRMGSWVYLNVSVPADVTEEEALDDVAPVYQYVGSDTKLVLVGDDLQLYCIYSGTPTPTVEWTKEGPEGTVELSYSDSVLKVPQVTEADAGTYTCHPSNSAGSGGRHQFDVEVESAPVLEEAPQAVSLPMGDTATFTCRGEGDPTPALQWTRDGVPMEGGETIEFTDLSTEDKSVLACNFSNEHGYTYSTAFLNVLSMPPEFEARPEDTLALEHELATLNCDAYGSPDPEIVWYRVTDDDGGDDDGGDDGGDGDDGDDEENGRIQDDEHYEVKGNDLVIKSVTTETVGQYRCVATNKFGQVRATAILESRTPTSVELSSESEAVRAGDAIELTCDFTHDPQLEVQVVWSKDNEELDLPGDDRMQDEETPEGDGEVTAVLRIEGSRGADSGVYTCKVTTELDDHEENTIIMVEDVPSPPPLLSVDCDQDSAFLRWSAGGENNAPILSFSVQFETDLQPGEWRETDSKLPANQTTTEVSVRPGRDYHFRVVAENRVGRSPPGSILNCTTPPAPPANNPQNVTLGEGSATSLMLGWEPVAEEDQQGPVFYYEIIWRELDDDETQYDDMDEDTGETEDDGDETDDGDEDDDDEDEDDSEWEKKIVSNWQEDGARLTGLSPHTRYVVKIKAMNAAGPSADGVPTRVATTDPAAPSAAPSPLRVGEVKADSAVLLWPPLDERDLRGELKGYKLNVWARGEDQDGDGDEDDEGVTDDENDDVYVEGDVRRAELTGLTPYTEYFVRVRADNTAYEGVYGQSIYFWTRQGRSSPVTNLKAKPVSSTSLIAEWDPPARPNGKITSYYIYYKPVEEDADTEDDGEGDGGAEGSDEVVAGTAMELDDVDIEARTEAVDEDDDEEPFVIVHAPVHQVKLSDLEEGVEYRITVKAKNAAGFGQKASVAVAPEAVAASVPVVPVFSWSYDEDDQDIDGDGDDNDDDKVLDKDDDGDIDEDDVRNVNVIIGDTDEDGDVDEDDVLDTDGDGDIDQEDIAVADIDNDGDVDEDDVRAADRDGDGDVDITDVGDEDGDGDFDGADVIAADEDGDGDIDASDDDEESTLLEDHDKDGDIDIDDVIDVDGDGDVDEDDIAAADVDNDGDVDRDDLNAADRDGDGDIDAADILDLDGDGRVDGDDLEVTDRDGDGDIDREDFILRQTFVGDTDRDGDVDEDDILDLDGDGDIDQQDINVADIDNDGDVDEDDVRAGDRDGDGDVDAHDIGDEDGDGDVDGKDVIAADEDGDGDIDGEDEDNEMVILQDRDGDGILSAEDLQDIDGDGDVDSDDRDVLDVDDDGDIDEDDLKIIDKDGDGDVDARDIVDFDGDGTIDEDDFDVKDRDGDGDIDATDFSLRRVFLADTNDDGVINEKDVLDNDGDGDVDAEDVAKADIDDDGDVDEDDVKRGDHDGDGDIDGSDVSDLDGDGQIDEDDVEVKDRDGDGDIDYSDYANRRLFLGDTDGDGDVDRDDVLDTDGDGDVDEEDIDVADINNDGFINEKDVRAGDRDGDGDIDIADIGDEDNDGDVDGDDVEAADEDGDGDIDASDDDGDDVILTDRDGDGDIDRNDVTDIDGDGDVDDDDVKIADVDNDGDVDRHDVKAADRDGDGDIDSADIVDIDGDGDVDGKDLVASDRDGDGDVDGRDILNRQVILRDSDGDGDVDEDDVLDTDGDGDVDAEDIDVADIDNDGDVDIDDVHAADRDGDGDVDARDITDRDNDGDIDADDVISADRDGDGDIDAADDGEGIDVKINWRPDFENHPGSEFFVQYRPEGTNRWRQSPVEEKSLQQTLRGLDPYRRYEVQVVAKDGQFETPSDVILIGPFRKMESDGGPTVGAVQEGGFNPAMATWFIIAVLVAVTMMLVICFSMWAYHHRLARIAELRKALYEGYQPASQGAAAPVGDVEAGGAEEEQPITAQAQRQQMAAMMRRQDTIQSVDSFASHDDDFAEYGDETMATFNEDGSLIYQKI